MSNALTPEKRLDKHGHLVTRWTAPFENLTTPKRLPAPAAPSPDSTGSLSASERAAKIAAAQGQLLSYGSSNENRTSPRQRPDNIEQNLGDLLDYSPAIFDQVMESAKPGSAEMFCWLLRLRNKKYDPDFSSDQKLLDYRRSLISFRFVRDIAARKLGYEISPRQYHNVLTEVDIAVRSIIHPLQARGEIPDDETIESVAIFVYLHDLHTDKEVRQQDPHGTVYDDHAQHIEYIASRLPEVHEILAELKQRNTHDREVIRMLLDSPHGALREGEL